MNTLYLVKWVVVGLITLFIVIDILAAAWFGNRVAKIIQKILKYFFR